MSAVRLHRVLVLCGFLGCVLSSASLSQERAQDAVKARTDRIDAIVRQSTAENPAALATEHLEDLASRLLHHASDAECIGPCIILVTNFVFPDGSTSAYGKWVADKLSSLFASNDQVLGIVDRRAFENILQKDRISSKLQNSESVASWLGQELSAMVVVVGEVKKIRNDFVEVSARFVNAANPNLIGPSAEVILFVERPAELSPTDGLLPLPLLPPLSGTLSDLKVYRMGQDVSSPTCYFMPNPPMSAAGMRAKFNGTLIAEGIVGTDGTIKGAQIVQGAPYGLVENTLTTLKTWKCNPGMLEGKPVATLVPFEVTFRTFQQH
jgi:hypothetical protein